MAEKQIILHQWFKKFQLRFWWSFLLWLRVDIGIEPICCESKLTTAALLCKRASYKLFWFTFQQVVSIWFSKRHKCPANGFRLFQRSTVGGSNVPGNESMNQQKQVRSRRNHLWIILVTNSSQNELFKCFVWTFHTLDLKEIYTMHFSEECKNNSTWYL